MSDQDPNADPVLEAEAEAEAEALQPILAPPMTESDYRERLEKGFQMRGIEIPEITDAQVLAFMADGLTPPEAFDTLTA